MLIGELADAVGLSRLRFIRSAQAAGLTLAEIGSVIDIPDTGDMADVAFAAICGIQLPTALHQRFELGAW